MVTHTNIQKNALLIVALVALIPGILNAEVASNPTPADGEVGVSPVNTTLSAVVQSPSGFGSSVDVEFYGREKPIFSIVVLPDTQKYSASYPDIFTAQTQWIVDNKDELNIVFVIHEGDIVNTWNSTTEWDRAKASMSVLDGVVPYSVVPGDHDHEGEDPDGSSEYYESYFPAWNETYSYNNNTNNYRLMTIAGEYYIFLSLDFCPSQDELDWANAILTENSGRIGVLTTHALLDTNADYYGSADYSRYPDGSDNPSGDTSNIWYDLINLHENVQLVLCGHMHGEARRTDVNLDGAGNPVHQLLANYQGRTNGGNGWLRIMTFVPAEDKVYVQTYSPWLDQYESDADSEFVLDLPIADTGAGFEFLGTDTVSIDPGTGTGTASAIWPYDLNLGTGYEWYVAVADTGGQAVDGPVWSFTTTSSNTTVNLQSPVDETVSQNPVIFTVDASCLVGALQDASLYLGSPAQVEDAQITESTPSTPAGENTSINVDGENPHAHALLKFRGVFGEGPGQVPPGATIDSATLGINCTNVGATMDLYRVTEDWSEATVTWNTAPGYDSSSSLPGDCSATGWREIPVTQFVQAWSDGQPNYGILLTDTGTDGVDFHSSEGATPPVLTVTYNDLPLQFTVGSTALECVETKPLSGGTFETVTFSQTLGDGEYIWNCLVTTTDGEAWAPADAQFTVDSTNDPPTAVDDAYSMSENDASLTVSAAEGVLANDNDPEGQSITAELQTPPSGGSLGTQGLATDGSFTYTPNAGFTGTDSFTYVANDGTSDSNPATVAITVNPNQAPVADAGPDQTVPDNNGDGSESVTLDGSASSDADGTISSYSWTENDVQIATGVAPSVSLTLGTHTITLTVTDDTGASATDTVTITVEVPSLFSDDFESGGFAAGSWQASSQASVESSAAYTGSYGALLKKASSIETTVHTGAVTTAKLSFWARVDGLQNENLYVEWFDNGNDGWQPLLTLTGTTQWPVTPFSYELDPITESQFKLRFYTDGNAGNDLAMIDDIVVIPVTANTPPTAVDDAASMDEDTATTVAVLANDSDIDGDFLSVADVTDPANGTALVNPDDSITYTPNANYSGTDSFDYTLSDGKGGTATATVTIMVNPVNDVPVASDDSAVTQEDTPVTIGVLANDSDVDGDSLDVVDVTHPANGTAVINGDNSITYTPNASYNGDDSFTYTISDGNGGSAGATVSVTVSETNAVPVANDDSYSVNEDNPLTVAAPGVLVNDTDADGDILTASLASGPSHGSLTLNTDGSFAYTPNANYNGSDSFVYTVSDGKGGADTATVTISIAAVNDAPATNNDAYTMDQDAVLNISAPGVLDNDIDVDGDSLTAAIVSAPSNGSLALTADGSFTYTPTAGFSGTDSFTYTASDGNGGSATATVTISVQAVSTSLFSEDFESGGFTAGGWTTTPQATVESTAGYNSAYGAQLKKTSSMETTINTGGATAVTLTFSARVDGLKNEYLYIEWSYDSNTWTTLGDTLTGTTSWQSFSYDLQSITESQFKLRFRTDGNAGNDLAMIDDIVVE